MVALNFNPRFVAPIRDGLKKQTIRRRRQRDPHPGDLLQLYVGQRSPRCHRIGEARCTQVLGIELHIDMRETGVGLWRWAEDTIGVPDHSLHAINDRFAQDDGFGCAADMLAFFRKHARPEEIERNLLFFAGNLIRWEPLW